MPSDKIKLTFKGLAALIVEPNSSILDIRAMRQAQLTAIMSALALVTSIIWTIVSATSGAPAWIPTSMSLFALALLCAYILSRMTNYKTGSTLLVGSLIVWGFVYALFDPQLTVLSIILLIGSAALIGSVLLSLRANIIFSAIAIIGILILPLITSVSSGITASLAGGLFVIITIATIITVFRSNTEQQQSSELQDLRDGLEKRVEERTRRFQSTAEIAQTIAATSTLAELLHLTVDLLTDRLRFYHAGIYLLDETGKHVVLRAAQSPVAAKMMEKARRFGIGSSSVIGWVAQNKLPRVATNAAEDALHLKNELLAETQSEAVIPIQSKDRLLGVLDVQSVQPDAFNDWNNVATLQTLANQVAASIQNVRALEAAQFDVQDVTEVYRIGYQIAHVQKESEIVQAIQDIFAQTPHVSIYMAVETEGLRVETSFDPKAEEAGALPDFIPVTISELEDHLATGFFVGEGGRLNSLPYNLVRILRQLRIFSVALIPVIRSDATTAIMLIGTREKQPLAEAAVRPYINIAKLIANSLERIQAIENIEYRVNELEALTTASQEISTARELSDLYGTLLRRVRQTLGDVSFLVAIYDATTNSISVPYMYEKGFEGGGITSIETFPLGEGLTSVLIRTKQPLMLVEDTEKRAAALGAKIVGRSAKSWLGAPLLIGGEVIGAIIVQDIENEHAFDEGDMRFITTLANQVAGAIYNVRLLEQTRKRALQLQTAAEIARDISGSLDLSELLLKAVNLVRERFNFYHAAVFLVDPGSEFVTIREATGEAGVQMKRAGHKLAIGSTSIVGFVSSSGEPLVVNDTSRDATYYANPLLPETRSEVGLPLKVGSRILGVLDVQSTNSYAFSDEDINVLRILADQMAVAVINSELFAETQEHLSQHRLLHHVTTAAASGTTLEEALNSAVQGLQVTMGGDRVAIMLADREKQFLEVRSAVGYSDEVYALRIPFGDGITGWVAMHQQPLRVDDISKDPRYIKISGDVSSELAIPLVYRGELLGVLNVESDQVAAFSENDEEMLGTLGGSLAAIIANTRLIEQVRRQADRERLIYELTTKIRRSTDMQSIMATTATELSKALGARRAQIKISPLVKKEAVESNEKTDNSA